MDLSFVEMQGMDDFKLSMKSELTRLEEDGCEIHEIVTELNSSTYNHPHACAIIYFKAPKLSAEQKEHNAKAKAERAAAVAAEAERIKQANLAAYAAEQKAQLRAELLHK